MTATRLEAQSLSVRLAVVFGLLLVAAVFVVAGVSLTVARSRLAHTLDEQLQSSAASFQRGPASRVTRPRDLVTQTRRWLAEHPLPEGQMAAIRISGGTVLTSAGGLDLFEVRTPHELLAASHRGWWNLRGSEGAVRGLTLPIRARGRQLGTLVLLAYERPVYRTLNALRTGIVFASAGGLALVLLLGAALVGRSLRPLRTMAAEVEAIETTADLSRRLRLGEQPGEIGRLADAFDRTLARLEQAFATQRRFVADASHELRTPLTVVRGQLELLGDRLDGARRTPFLRAQDELDRMARIVDDLLLLARLDEGTPLRTEPVELELALREATLRGILLAPREVHVDAEPSLFAQADPDRLQQVLTNLVTNAVKHTGEGGSVVLTSERENGFALLRVTDDGPGIPPDELPHIFERFYRGSTERATSPQGSGLGLAIAASLIAAMHGTINAQSVPPRGTTFTIRLPVAASPRGSTRDL